MTSTKDLLNLNYIPKLNECNLQLIQQFYDEFLGKYLFMYKLSNGTEIKIRFYTENLPHLLGIHKVVKDKQIAKLYKGAKGYNGLSDGSITIQNLIDLDNQLKDKQLGAIASKITCFHLIPKLLDECNIVKFYPQRVQGNSSLRSEFILFHEELGVKLHLGVITGSDNIYTPETFIPKGPRDRDKNRLTNGQEFKKIIERDKLPISPDSNKLIV